MDVNENETHTKKWQNVDILEICFSLQLFPFKVIYKKEVRHGCFPAKRKERFFYTRWLEIEKKPKSFVGPLPALDLGPLSVLVLRHVSDSDSFRYQASTEWEHAQLSGQYTEK